MTIRLEYPQGATPLDPDEIMGLIPSHISTQGELDEAEQANILKASHWALTKKKAILSDNFLRELHKRMFGDVWRWAGQYRITGKNLGVPAIKYPRALENYVRAQNTGSVTALTLGMSLLPDFIIGSS